jgi:hypothetical protein
MAESKFVVGLKSELLADSKNVHVLYVFFFVETRSTATYTALALHTDFQKSA